jgi:hypothetical protein
MRNLNTTYQPHDRLEHTKVFLVFVAIGIIYNIFAFFVAYHRCTVYKRYMIDQSVRHEARVQLKTNSKLYIAS